MTIDFNTVQEISGLCPYCNSRITLLIDPTPSSQYIEDCEVCCRPMTVKVLVDDQDLNVELLHENDIC